jgi:hypothetical protein
LWFAQVIVDDIHQLSHRTLPAADRLLAGIQLDGCGLQAAPTMARVRIYHRLVRKEDIPALQARD